MKVLIVGGLPSTASLAYKLALDNKDCSIDYLGSRLNFRLKNLNFVDLKKKSRNRLEDFIEYIDQHHEVYDFVYAHEFIFQESLKFQELKKRITTPILCPESKSSILEDSKLHTKELFKNLDIPSPEYFLIDQTQKHRLGDYFSRESRAVLKLDKCLLPTGHGTFIADSSNYQKWIDSIRSVYLDENIFLEEYIQGQEISFHILSNGKQWIYLGSARDYKKIQEQDQGTNTSGTGSYSPVDYIDDEIYDRVSDFVDRLINHLNSIGEPYRGILFLGIIIDTQKNPWVLELNTRPGNPEFSAMLPTIGPNLLENLYAAARGESLSELSFKDIHAVSVQLLHKNYSHFRPERTIYPNLEKDETLLVNTLEYFNLYDNVYACITAESDTRISAAEKIQNYLSRQDLGTYRFRRDIGIQV